MLHHALASALVVEHHRDLACQAGRRELARRARDCGADSSGTGRAGPRIPRYRVSWSRAPLPTVSADRGGSAYGSQPMS